MRCPNCDNEIEESLFSSALTFCPYCGGPLATAGQEQDKDMIAFCPYCGKELTAQTKFCPHCGKTLPEHSAAPAEKQEVREFIGRAAGAIKSTLGPERKLRKLYRQWSEYSGLPDEEIPALMQASRDAHLEEERDKRRFPVLYLVLAVAVLILAIGIILLVGTC